MSTYFHGWRRKLGVITLLMACGLIIRLASSSVLLDSQCDDIKKIPYSMPVAVTKTIERFASECDILTLGEVHGTQEVPLVAISLLNRLTELGYNVLALEIPDDQQEPLIAWANGSTNVVPSSFRMMFIDGRGNLQALSLIRIALSEPYKWRLVCFDQSEAEAKAESEKLKHESHGGNDKPQVGSSEMNDSGISLFRKRDSAMAANLTKQLNQYSPRPKVLAICGSLHNRIENRSPELQQWWPSFAANLQEKVPTLMVGAINIQFHSGGFFMDGKVNHIRGQKIDVAEAHPAIDTGYNWELNLPHATPATFLWPLNPVPYKFAVFFLALLSVFLFLSKPRHHKPQSPPEPSSEMAG